MFGGVFCALGKISPGRQSGLFTGLSLLLECFPPGFHDRVAFEELGIAESGGGRAGRRCCAETKTNGEDDGQEHNIEMVENPSAM